MNDIQRDLAEIVNLSARGPISVDATEANNTIWLVEQEAEKNIILLFT